MDIGLASSSAPSAGLPVYLGVWTNWSRGRVFGTTLTLTRQDGDLLIAFIAFFVGFVGTRFWRICCLFFHVLYSSQSPQDGLYHQRQAVLRNASDAETGLVFFLQMVWAWRGYSRRAIVRMLGPVVIASSCVFGFVVAGGYSSRVSTATGNEVLISSENCGWLNLSINASPDLIQGVYSPWSVSQLVSEANYARQCYGLNSSGTLNCATFFKQNMLDKMIVDDNYKCPFPGGICRQNDSNLMLDSGFLDSNDDFGINTPPHQRFWFRTLLQCAPLTTENRTSVYNMSSDRSYTRYHFGNFHSRDVKRNFTYEYINDRVYETNAETANGTSAMDDYSLGVQAIQPYQGDINFASTFDPIPELTRPDADLFLIFLSSNGITFANKTEDPWYRATKPWKTYVLWFGDNPQRLPAYMQDEPASPLACVQQFQFCNPNLPEASRCSPLSSSNDLGDNSVGLFNATEASLRRFMWFASSIVGQGASTGTVVTFLGSQALTGRNRLNDGYQGSIPVNQWQRDAAFWYSASLASFQSAFLGAASGPSDPDMLIWSQKPSYPEEKALCRSQKIRSTMYSSFSIFGLGVIFGTGGLISILSYSLSPLLTFLQKRRKFRAYANVEWCVNETLQLQRLAHEGVGCGTWSKAADWVPTTRADEELGLLDISDPDHPKLQRPSVTTPPRVTKITEIVAEKLPDDKFTEEKRTNSDISERSEVEITQESLPKA